MFVFQLERVLITKLKLCKWGRFTGLIFANIYKKKKRYSDPATLPPGTPTELAHIRVHAANPQPNTVRSINLSAFCLF
jgi:hypothetical protein